jgi:hypothetical protein
MESSKLFEHGADYRRSIASIEQALIALSITNEKVVDSPATAPARSASPPPLQQQGGGDAGGVETTSGKGVEPPQSAECGCERHGLLGAETSAKHLKLLLTTLRSLGNVLEKAQKWRRAAAIYSQLKTLATRLLGPQHTATKAAGLRAKRALENAKHATPDHDDLGKSLSLTKRVSPGSPTRGAAASDLGPESPGNPPASPGGPVTGDESWLN